MTTTFKSPYVITLRSKDNKGNSMRIIFTALSRGGSIYVTDKPSEIQAIKNSSYWKAKDIFEVDAPKVEEKKAENCTEVAEVKNCSDARLYLQEQGYAAPMSKQGIIEEALKHNIKFPNL